MLSEEARQKKATYCMIVFNEMSRLGKSKMIESKLVVARGGRKR